MEDNRFNLIDEEWIPVAGHGRASLRQVFSDGNLKEIGGNPVEKIALFKLLLAIAQSACRPLPDDEAWEKLRVEGMMARVQEYLNQHRDSFWLYGERPFLQMPAVDKARKQPLGAVQLEVASGNTTVVTEFQQEKSLTDAEKAVLLVTLMGFACGGKKTDNSIVLTKGYSKKPSGKTGPSLGISGFLHTFIQRGSIAETIYLNLFTEEQLEELTNYPVLGKAPWECMPAGEDDETARALQKSYMGRLVPLSRFVLFFGDEIHYSEGILYPDQTAGVVDPTVSFILEKQKAKALWTNPNKRPWRELAALLSMAEEGKEFSCNQIKLVVQRLKELDGSFQVWSGGVKVSSNAGEQYVTGDDDFVASCVTFPTDIYSENSDFFISLKKEMEELGKKGNLLYACASGYFKTLKAEPKRQKSQGALMTNKFWQLCEGQFQNLIQACHENEEAERTRLLQKCHSLTEAFVCQIYNEFCPRETSRQLEAWAKNRPFSSAKGKE